MVGVGQPRLTVLVGSAALAATVAWAMIPDLRFTYVSATTRVAMEAAQAVIAGVVAVLVHGRVRRRGRLADQVLVLALGFSAAGNLLTVALRATSEDRDTLTPDARSRRADRHVRHPSVASQCGIACGPAPASRSERLPRWQPTAARW